MAIKKITVWFTDGITDDPPENLQDYISWLVEKIGLIPPEFRSSATITTDIDDYEYPKVSISIQYFRPESQDEIEENYNRKMQEEKQWLFMMSQLKSFEPIGIDDGTEEILG